MKKFVVFIIVAVFGVCSHAQDIRTKLVCPDHLFYITKSDNDNVLFYDAAIRQGKLDSRNPVNIYWIMYAQRGQKEGLTFLERPQFGLNVKEVTAGEKYNVFIKTKALVHRPIEVSFDENGCVQATAEISGTRVFVDSVFIQIDPSSGFIPKVPYIDLFGTDIETGIEVTERVYNK